MPQFAKPIADWLPACSQASHCCWSTFVPLPKIFGSALTESHHVFSSKRGPTRILLARCELMNWWIAVCCLLDGVIRAGCENSQRTRAVVRWPDTLSFGDESKPLLLELLVVRVEKILFSQIVVARDLTTVLYWGQQSRRVQNPPKRIQKSYRVACNNRWDPQSPRYYLS